MDSRPTTAAFEENSLISYLHRPEDKVVDILATRTIQPESELIR
jgi:hypothetical protein